MASNGHLTPAELSPIRPYGELANAAAAAWNATRGPADNGLKPSGPELSTYRSFAGQEKTWAIYQAGGNLAAFPGTSVHGLGKAVDLLEEWMRSWIDDHGAKFGWKKIEAFSEWWHVNFVGGVSFPTFITLQHGSKGKRVRFYTKRLAFIRRSNKPAFLTRWFWRYTPEVETAVTAFQHDHGLPANGVIGEDTAHAISAEFHKQYAARNKRRRVVKESGKLTIKKGGRKRRARDTVRLRP